MTYGIKLRPGFVGVVQITAIEVKATEYGECAFTELTVIETNMPEQHWCGAPVVWVQSLKNVEIAKSAFKEFLQALKVPEAEMDTTMNAAIESPFDNALTDRRVHVQTHETQTKNGPFVVYNWSIYAPAESGPTTNGDPTADTATCGEPLRPEHLAYLGQRAVPLDVATAAGLVSVDAARAALLLQLLPEQVPSGGIAIPYPHLTPRFWRVRMDGAGGGAKFMAPASRGAPIYDAVAAAGREVAGPLLVSEGPIKALALIANGFRGLGLGGAETGLTDDHKLDPSWESIELPAEGAILLPDADINTNYAVMRGTARLARALTEAHPDLPVKLARLPGPGKQGPDDYLAEHGKEALGAILVTANPINRPSEVAAKLIGLEKDARAREIAKLLGDRFFLVSVLVWGTSELFTVRECFKPAGATKLLDAALKETQEALRKANRFGNAAAAPGTGPYRRVGGRFCRVYVTAAGLEELEPFANFAAEIEREVTLDDGVSPQLMFEIRGTRENGEDLGTIEVSAAEFESRAWPVSKWGARAVIYGTAGAMAHTRAATQLFSPHVERTHAYNHTGYREIEGKLVYLHGGGAVGGENVAMHLDPALERYVLPPVAEDPRGAALCSLRMLDVAPDRLSVPLHCAVYLAPLCHWISPDFVVWVWGKTGSYKTSVTATAQGHFGDFDFGHLPGSWSSTYASLEALLSRAKDALVTIDDNVPSGAADYDRARQTATQVVRSVGNNQSRGRMRADLTARPARPPRGLVVSTSEDMLSGESVSARALALRFEKDVVNRDVLSELQKNARRLPHAMRSYVEFVATQDAWLRDVAPQRLIELRGEFARAGQHARAPDAAARLALAGEMFARWGQSIGLYTPRAAAALHHRIHAALVEASAAQAIAADEREPVTRFLNMLASLIAQGKAVLGADVKAVPSQAAVGGETFLGWRDGDRLLLLPEPTYTMVVREISSGREGFPWGAETLWGELLSMGLIAEHDEKRTRKKRMVGGAYTRVLVLWGRALAGPEDRAIPPDGPSGQSDGSDPAPSALPNAPHAPHVPRSDLPSGAHVTLTGTSAFGANAPHAPQDRSTDTCIAGLPNVAAEDRAPVGAGPSSLHPRSGACGAGGEKGGDPDVLGAPRIADPGGADRGTVGRSYVLVTDASQLPAVADALSSAESVALDTETTGLDPLEDRVRLVQLGLPNGRIYVIDVWATGGLGPVAEVLCRVPWLGHNLAFDVGFMRQLGVAPTKVVDTMLLAQVLDCGLHSGVKGYFTLSALLGRHLGLVVSKDQQKSDWAGALSQEQLLYAACDVRHLHELVEVLAREVDARGLTPTASLECEVLPAIADLQLAGVCFDRERWIALTEQKRREAADAKAFVERELDIKNANSAKAQVLPGLQKRLGPGVKGTSAEDLAPYADDPVVTALKKFRAAETFVKNHGEPILASMIDGRVRGRWHQMGTTGRMSCSDPPLLNLPKSKDVRSCVVAPRGCVLVAADYGQIELRVAAQMVPEPRLIEVFRSGGDPHRMIAALIAGVPESEVTEEQRSRAKPINFGFLFGQGPPRFMATSLKDYKIAFTLEEARAFKADYLRAYPGIARWQKLVGAKRPAEMRTLGGRIRAFSDRLRGYSERLNHPIQGTALDGFKAAMAILHPRLAALGARIVLAVHDELVVEALEDQAEEVKDCVEAGMIEGMRRYLTEVPVVVEAKIVRSWAEAK
ncbi:MAG: DUF3854 domain-containing protein [Phycisphaerales bacterium]|nr:DUF3854 domain-containing protein [Phycisphaerales bacterium]